MKFGETLLNPQRFSLAGEMRSRPHTKMTSEILYKCYQHSCFVQRKSEAQRGEATCIRHIAKRIGISLSYMILQNAKTHFLSDMSRYFMLPIRDKWSCKPGNSYCDFKCSVPLEVGQSVHIPPVLTYSQFCAAVASLVIKEIQGTFTFQTVTLYGHQSHLFFASWK